MQPDVANYQCLACGELTNAATGALVPNNIPNVVTSPSGHPVPELTNGVEEVPAGLEEDRRTRAYGPEATMTDTAPEPMPARVDEAYIEWLASEPPAPVAETPVDPAPVEPVVTPEAPVAPVEPPAEVPVTPEPAPVVDPAVTPEPEVPSA
jgi:hypothetical protein